jgi:hypothetical protein
MRENRTSGSEGGEAGTNRPSLPLSALYRLFPQFGPEPPLRSNKGSRPEWHLNIRKLL